MRFIKLGRYLKARSCDHACEVRYFDHVFIACNKNIEGDETRSYRPVPPKNFSAGYYELGGYSKCISSPNEAIALLGDGLSSQEQAQVEQSEPRISKVEIHAFKASSDDKQNAIEKILNELPRMRTQHFHDD
jgi:hypothetical protein